MADERSGVETLEYRVETALQRLEQKLDASLHRLDRKADRILSKLDAIDRRGRAERPALRPRASSGRS